MCPHPTYHSILLLKTPSVTHMLQAVELPTPMGPIIEPYEATYFLAELVRGGDALAGGGRRARGASLLANHSARDARYGRGGASTRSHGRLRRPQNRGQRHPPSGGGLLHAPWSGTASVPAPERPPCPCVYRQGAA